MMPVMKKMKQDTSEDRHNTISRYDRQIRIWNSSGQQCLENSNVLVLGANTISSEAIKNLVLSGIGSYTLVDSKIVSKKDIEGNFFVCNKDLGRPLSKTLVENLNELNPHVRGASIIQSVDEFVLKELNFSECNLVICCNQNTEVIQKVNAVCWDLSIPVIVCSANGFFGSMKYYAAQHCIVEGHIEQIEDMRIDEPFEELTNYVDSISLDSLNSIEKAHVPYVVLMIKKLKEYKNLEGIEALDSFQEKKSFKSFLETSTSWSDEENYLEMISNAIRLSSKYSIPSHIQSIFCHSCLSNLPQDFCDIPVKNLKFWIIVKAIKEFVSSEVYGNGKLPLIGTIPDMKADTKRYIELQEIYKKKAKHHIDIIYQITQKILADIKCFNVYFNMKIPREEIKIFCKNSNQLKVIELSRPKYTSLPIYRAKIHDLYCLDPKKLDSSIFESLNHINPIYNFDDFQSPEILFIVLEAVVLFKECIGYYPGQDCTIRDGFKDKDMLNIICYLICENWRNLYFSSNQTRSSNDSESADQNYLKNTADNFLAETLRSRGAQLHSIAAIMGGVVSQEAIKLITRHYVTIDLPAVFDGITSKFHLINPKRLNYD
ncbi:hypothetical protein BB561_005762 [Smittium simulii]|uniref:NEDD8-activating enzyme E1 regulatory subunit n=1 Tax=Smittium simulii TaxID=133385 RepID=A0A2T9Y8F8_9FUNG|nr:hypothetical protein BB561_005762 [Smittium simulii]